MIVDGIQVGDLVEWRNRPDPILWAWVAEVGPSFLHYDVTVVTLMGLSSRTGRAEYWIWPIDFVKEHMDLIAQTRNAIQ